MAKRDKDWMDTGTEVDVQRAIDSQAIQTALERQSSGLSDVALQSYLTNAPIPRFAVNAFNTAFANGVGTVCTYQAGGSIYYDPYQMLNLTTGNVTIPIDGFYAIEYYATCNGGGVAGYFQYIMQTAIGAGGTCVPFLGSSLTPGAGAACHGAIAAVRPFTAGNVINVLVVNQTGGAMAASEGYFGGAWVAPYKNFKNTTTQGGN